MVPPLCPSFLQSPGSNFVAWDAHDTARCGVWTLCIANGSFAQEVHLADRVQQSFRSMWHPCSRVQTACRRLAVFYFLGCLFSTCTGRYGRLPPTPCHRNAPCPLTGDGWCGERDFIPASCSRLSNSAWQTSFLPFWHCCSSQMGEGEGELVPIIGILLPCLAFDVGRTFCPRILPRDTHSARYFSLHFLAR